MRNQTLERPATADNVEAVFKSSEETTRNDVWRRVPGAIGRIVLAGVVIVAGAGATYWKLYAPVAVRAHEVTTGEIVAEVMGTGTLEPHIKATVGAKITGRIAEVLVDQGDRVAAGQLLFRLDDHDLKHQVEAEAASVDAKRANVQRLQAEIVSAKAALDLATTTYERAESLIAKKALAQAELDSAVAALTNARAGMARAEAAAHEGQRQLVAAERACEFHQARLDDAVITAPFDALVVRRDRNPGDMVVPGSSVLALVSTQELWVSAWIDETEIARLRTGQPARIVFRSEPDQPYRGHVVRIGHETDRETREFLVDVAPENLPENWTVGQRAEVYIETARTSDTVFLPVRFAQRRDGEAGAFVAVNGRTEWRTLKLGLRGRGKVEVSDGLQAGDIVVIPADPKASVLADGRRVATR